MPHQPIDWSARRRAFGRGLVAACPNCGGRGLFRTYFTMHERCPTCGYRFEREEGYWLGAMVVAIGVVQVVFGIIFVGGMLVTWPDVPWNALLIVLLVLNGTLPFLIYPWTKTVWVGLHLAFVPPEAAEEADAATARAARDDARGHDGGSPDGTGRG
jgi:uncharacterized protein (DUF983 family)